MSTKFLDAKQLRGMTMTLRLTHSTSTDLLGRIIACSN